MIVKIINAISKYAAGVVRTNAIWITSVGTKVIDITLPHPGDILWVTIEATNRFTPYTDNLNELAVYDSDGTTVKHLFVKNSDNIGFYQADVHPNLDLRFNGQLIYEGVESGDILRATVSSNNASGTAVIMKVCTAEDLRTS